MAGFRLENVSVINYCGSATKINNPSIKGGLGTARLPGDERSEEHMKKSEAASQLAKKIQATWPELDQVSPHHCEHIITWLEQMGMNPPLIPIHRSSRDLSQIQPTHVFEWEDESET